MLDEPAPETLHGVVRGAAVRRPGYFVERQQIHFAAQAMQQLDQALGVGQAVVDVAQQHVLKGDSLAYRQGEIPARLQQSFDRICLVDRHDTAAHGIGGGVERDGEICQIA